VKKPSEKDIQEWKSVYEEYKALLRPNVKHAIQVLEYIKKKYPLKEETSETYKEIVVSNIKMNNHLAAKIPDGKESIPILFTVPNQGNAVALYEAQEKVYKGCQIYLGVELETGYFFIEGSDELADEVTAFKGLDSDDMVNFYLVANYVRCLKKYNMLDEVLKVSGESK